MDQNDAAPGEHYRALDLCKRCSSSGHESSGSFCLLDERNLAGGLIPGYPLGINQVRLHARFKPHQALKKLLKILGVRINVTATANSEVIPEVVFSRFDVPSSGSWKPSKINNGILVHPRIVNASSCVNVEPYVYRFIAGRKDLSWSRCGMRSNTL